MNNLNESTGDIKKLPFSAKKIVLFVGIAASVLLIAYGGMVLNKFMSSESAIRNPSFDHYHFRMMVYAEGETVDFSQPQFQQTYEKNQCAVDLANEPFHFHDNLNQFAHVHWDGMTGGLFLKNYGWNFIGGSNDTLGWRFDDNWLSPNRVPVYNSAALPGVDEDKDYYVYVQSEDKIIKKNWQDFLFQDFETFFAKESTLNPREGAWYDTLFTRVSAHGDVDDGHAEEDVDLSKLNNLLGDLVIFAQDDEPSAQQVYEAFDSLVDLPDSTCGG